MIKPKSSKKYVPHLPNHLAVCAANYGRFLRVLPDLDAEDVAYSFSVSEGLGYDIKLLDFGRYTSEVEISQHSESMGITLPSMRVRLYHDAKLAEVVSCQNVSGLKASYSYPNPQMLHANEKEQLNIFLAEWLNFCLAAQASCADSN